MTSQIVIALIGVFAALIGAAIGGLITYFTNRDLKKKEWMLSVIREEINDRKRLYSEFLAEAYRITILSLQTKCGDLREFDILHRYFAQIELLASDDIVNAARTIVDLVIDRHSKECEKHDISFVDLKKTFINLVKEELSRLKNS
ncbi:MAG: hypothetical protein CVU71_08300 [Deltaproteobacteria bacterium HGW-Deltaproteobacteria-6]|jgi:hypothetical protein|nr:MAG: hypothetical protein CVU71_08300 [Deltaproteobacteria bacterium HGW-Deltaproteobacteria-6]